MVLGADWFQVRSAGLAGAESVRLVVDDDVIGHSESAPPKKVVIHLHMRWVILRLTLPLIFALAEFFYRGVPVRERPDGGEC